MRRIDGHRLLLSLYLCVEKRFTDVQRCGESGCQGSRYTARYDVAHRIVNAFGICCVLHSLVDYKMNALEWNIHGQLGTVRSVKGR